MTIKDALLKWSQAKFILRTRGLPRGPAPPVQNERPAQARRTIPVPTERQAHATYQAVPRPVLGLEQIAEELDRINARLLRAEGAANERRRRAAGLRAVDDELSRDWPAP